MSTKSGSSMGGGAQPSVQGWSAPAPRPSLQQSSGGVVRSSAGALQRAKPVGRRASVTIQTSLADKFFGSVGACRACDAHESCRCD